MGKLQIPGNVHELQEILLKEAWAFYYNYTTLWNLRRAGEEAYLNMCKMDGLLSFLMENQYNAKKTVVDVTLSIIDKSKFVEIAPSTSVSDKKLYSSKTIIECPANVEVYDSTGALIVTLEDGVEQDILNAYGRFVSTYRAFNNDFVKILYWNAASDYSLNLIVVEDGIVSVTTANAHNPMGCSGFYNAVLLNEEIITVSTQNPDVAMVIKPDGTQREIPCTEINIDPANITNVTGVSLPESIELEPGQSTTLSAVISPRNATYQDIEWFSDSEEIVRVKNGTVTAIKEGTARIICKTREGDYSDICNITVKKLVPSPLSYSVTFDANGGTGSMENSTATESVPFTLPNCSFTPPANKVFDKWTTNNGGAFADASSPSTTFTMPAGNVTVTATYKDAATPPVQTYSLTVINGTRNGDYEADTQVSIVANAAPEGKEFDKWTTTNGGTFADVSSASTTFIMSTGNVTVTATYKDITMLPVPTSYLINFDPNGGTVDITCMTTGTDGKLSVLPTPIYNGYIFNGWYTALIGGDQVTTDTIFNSDTTVYAQWIYNGDSGIIIPGGWYPSSGNTGISTATYSITISPVSDGSVKVSHTSTKKGTTVTISVTPNEGYKLDELTVTDSKGNKLKLTDTGNDKYTFTMPNSAVIVDAVFKLNEEPTMPSIAPVWVNYFIDVTESSWYYDAVKFVSENSLMNGLSSTIFAPDANLSRAQLAQILYNKENKPAVNSTSGFTDVTADN